MKDKGFFSIVDKIVSAISFLLALTTFWYSALPNIGFGDDGEMATAAIHFGVPHPSGYPLWTLLAGLFSRLPWGNAIWKINLFSGLTAAAAVAIFGLIASHSIRWFGLKNRSAPYFAGIITLLLSWSLPVWSQATIGKGTYSLHLFFMLALVALCYYWIHHPQWPSAFLSIAFCFALSMSNHHMTLPMALLPLLLMAWLRPKDLWEYLLYVAISASLFYLGFAALSHLPLVIKAAHRFLFLVIILLLIAVIAAVLLKKKFLHLREGVLLPYVIALGLLPYLYMPLASSTNPPMNWGYTKTEEGFFYSINRSGYWGTLSDQLQKSIGRAMGVPPATNKFDPHNALPGEQKNLLNSSEIFKGFMKRFWKENIQGMTPLPLLGNIATLILFFLLCFKSFKRKKPYQTEQYQLWIMILSIGFLLSAFLEPLTSTHGFDNVNWEMQLPWQGTCYAYLLLLTIPGLSWLYTQMKQLFKKTALISLPLSHSFLTLFFFMALIGATAHTFCYSLPKSSQRHNWLGWIYGHDLLSDLPPGSIFFGGSDAGRFIPTYMIFGESHEKPTFKRDPHFNRSDLYIITQHFLSEAYYDQYRRSLSDQYGCDDSKSHKSLLPQQKCYPKEKLFLPTLEQIFDIQNATLKALPPQTDYESKAFIINSTIAKAIFLANRDRHHFFVEESFPMKWSYPYAIPHGLCYEIAHDPVTTLDPKIIQRDHSFWAYYLGYLKGQPHFQEDAKAQRFFSSLRSTLGNIYTFRKLNQEAEYAYRQALELNNNNRQALLNLASLLQLEGRLQEITPLVQKAATNDPNDILLKKLLHQLLPSTSN